jgi:hypothetical protein
VKLKKTGRCMASLGVLATVLAVGSAASSLARPAEEEARFCCVANPRFAGTCKVELAEDESCGDVLAYLNNAASAGKTYCGTTPIRGGWAQVECQDEED